MAVKVIKGDINVTGEIQKNGVNLIRVVTDQVETLTDQSYDSTSENAQSGVAVAQAVQNKVEKSQTILDITSGVTSAYREIITSNKGTILKYETLYYTPQYKSSSDQIPTRYGCFDASTNKFKYLDINWTSLTITTSEVSYQTSISDLSTIRSGAEAGATAVQDSSYVHTDNNYTTSEKTKLEGLKTYVLNKTGLELEDLTYVEGQLYYCTSASDSFTKDTMYIGMSGSTIAKLSSTSIVTTPQIITFTISPSSAEVGSTASLTYSYSGKKLNQCSSIKIGTQDVSASTSGTITGTQSAGSTFTIIGTYDTDKTTRMSKTFEAKYRQFYGWVSGDSISAILTNLKNITSNTNNSTMNVKTYLQNSNPSSVTLSMGSTPKYFYFITKHSISSVISGGYPVPFSLLGTGTFTNSYNATYSVNVYRTDNEVFDDLDFIIS